MKDHIKHAQKSDWDQDVPTGPLFRGGPVKIAVDALRVAIVVAVGLAILPFRLIGALASGDDGDREPDSLWRHGQGEDEDTAVNTYVDPVSGEHSFIPTYPDQKPFKF